MKDPDQPDPLDTDTLKSYTDPDKKWPLKALLFASNQVYCRTKFKLIEGLTNPNFFFQGPGSEYYKKN